MPIKISFDAAMYQVVLLMAFVVPLSTAAASIAVGAGTLFIIVKYLRTREMPTFDVNLLEVLAVYIVCQINLPNRFDDVAEIAGQVVDDDRREFSKQQRTRLDVRVGIRNSPRPSDLRRRTENVLHGVQRAIHFRRG